MSKQPDYQFIKIKSFRTNKIQCDTLETLKSKYNIDVSNFIRIAIKEKIDRDKYKIKEQFDADKWPWA